MQIDDYSNVEIEIEDDSVDVDPCSPDIELDVPSSESGSYDDDDFVEEVMNEHSQGANHPAFIGRDKLPPNANSDGYIPNGSQELISTISDTSKTFKLYSKDGHDYVLYNGVYYRIDGPGTVTIGGVKYDKI